MPCSKICFHLKSFCSKADLQQCLQWGYRSWQPQKQQRCCRTEKWSPALCLIGKFEKKKKRDYYAVFQAKNASSYSDMRKAVIAHGSLRKLARERKHCVLTQGRALEWLSGTCQVKKSHQLSSRGLGWSPELEQCLIPKLLGSWGRLCDLGWPLVFKVLALCCKYSSAGWCISCFTFWFQLQTPTGSIPSLLNWSL